jgi:hypothetical protein
MRLVRFLVVIHARLSAGNPGRHFIKNVCDRRLMFMNQKVKM